MENTKNTKLDEKDLKKLLDMAEKRPKWATGIAAFFYNINLIAAFAFDSLLFYTPGRTETPPSVVGFITKILIIVAAYIIINIVLSVFIYGIFIPVYYASYSNSYGSFQRFLKKQSEAYKTKFGVQLLEKTGDLKTMGILAVFETVADTSLNWSKNMGEYKSFIKNDIDLALRTIKDPVLDENTINDVLNFFMELPDEFQKHATQKQTYVYTSIQYWVLMLCVVLFIIPIKYTIIGGVNSPELPSSLTGAFGAMGTVAKRGVSMFSKNESKVVVGDTDASQPKESQRLDEQTIEEQTEERTI